MAESVTFGEMGITGLRHSGGFVQEEYLRELSGDRWLEAVREMADDPTVGAILFAIEMLLRRVPLSVQPADDGPVAAELAQFVEECLGDMSQDWRDILAEILTMIPYGWAYLELVYKRRGGDVDDPERRSAYADGRIGWRKWSIRSQETRDRWEFDAGGGVQGMWQRLDGGGTVFVPIAKALLFRTNPRKGNPEGRALALDTPIPTPEGWATMGTIRVGDKVYDETGRIRYVTAKSEIWRDRPAYEVEFSTGHKIVADENHLWSVTTSNDRQNDKLPRILTTREIFDWLQRPVGNPIFSTGIAPVLDASNLPLPVDPYLLGYWLGDGSRGSGRIAVALEDYPNLKEQVERAGLTSTHNGDREAHVSGLNVLLRAAGVLDNKHVPALYLRSSWQQRLAILQGLMDTDGTANKGKDTACRFYNSNPAIVVGFCDLVRSLGGQPRVRVHTEPGRVCGTINGKTIVQKKPLYEVSFFLHLPAYRLERKRVLQDIKDSPRVRGHFIRNVRSVGVVDTICIEVDSPSHLFLAGDGMTPTHNSALRSAYRAWYYKRQIEAIEGTGVERDLAGLPVAYVPPSVLAAETPAAQAQLAAVKNIIANIRRNEQEGIVWPLVFDDAGHELYRLELLSSGGARQFDTSAIIGRYEQRIAMTVLADFIMLGHEAVGSYALSATKSNMFKTALEAWLESVAGVINAHAIPRLLRLNGMDTRLAPRVAFGAVGAVDVDVLIQWVSGMAAAGMKLFPAPELENKLRGDVGLPPLSEEEMRRRAEEAANPPAEGQGPQRAGADGMSAAEMAAALEAAQRIIGRGAYGD